MLKRRDLETLYKEQDIIFKNDQSNLKKYPKKLLK